MELRGRKNCNVCRTQIFKKDFDKCSYQSLNWKVLSLTPPPWFCPQCPLLSVRAFEICDCGLNLSPVIVHMSEFGSRDTTGSSCGAEGGGKWIAHRHSSPLAGPPRGRRIAGSNLGRPERHEVAALVGIAAKLRTVLAAHVTFQFVDRRRLGPSDNI